MNRFTVTLMLFAVLWSAIFLTVSNHMPIATSQPVPAAAVESSIGQPIENSSYKNEEEAVLKFINEYVVCGNGEVFTNIRPGSNELETLSESVGLFMNYCVLRNKKDLFDREYEFLKKNLMVQDTYVRWKFGRTEVSSNALMDDLRIAGALMDAYELWQNKEYIETARNIQQAIYSKQVEGNNLSEFYDWKRGVSKKSIPLCYLDLCNIYKLSGFNTNWLKVAENGLSTINRGRIENRSARHSPLFNKYYNYQTKHYSKDEEFGKGHGICLTYSIYTAINLACYNEDTEFFTSWLKTEMEKGKLCAWYDPETLSPSQDLESTAVYALGAVYARKAGETALYKSLIEKMLQFMVKDKTSPYYGGFGNPETGDFYSFDNLTALWALSLARE